MDTSGYLALSVLSTQTIWLPVSSVNPIVGSIDVTTGGVEIAATTGVDPTSFVTGAWETGTVLIDDEPMYLARVEVGPLSPLALPKGFYLMFVKLLITNPPAIVPSTSLLIF